MYCLRTDKNERKDDEFTAPIFLSKKGMVSAGCGFIKISLRYSEKDFVTNLPSGSCLLAQIYHGNILPNWYIVFCEKILDLWIGENHMLKYFIKVSL